MIKYFCDRCGKELTKERSIGYVAVNTKDKADGDLQGENEFEHNHYCSSCTKEIISFIRRAPEATEPETEKSQDTENECAETEEKPIEPVEKPSKPKKKEKQKERKKIDTGKIFALRRAGWTVKDIAGEMGLEPKQVTNQLYIYKDKYSVK